MTDAVVTLEYPLSAMRADVWVAARLGLRGALVMTAGWTTLALLGPYQSAQAGAYAFACAVVSLWLPRAGLVLLCLLLTIGISAISIGQAVEAATFLGVCLLLLCRRGDIGTVKPDGTYGDRISGHLLDGSHVMALVLLAPVLLASGLGTLPVLLTATLAADGFVWSVPAFVGSAVVLLPKVVSGRTIDAPGAGLLLPDAFSRHLLPIPSRLDLVDLVQILGHARWSLLPADVQAALTASLTLVGRHPVVLVGALGWSMGAFIAVWMRRAALRVRAGRAIGVNRLAAARLVALTSAGVLLAVAELVLAPAVSDAKPAPTFTAVVVQDLWHSALIVVALVAVDTALLHLRRIVPWTAA